MCAKCDHHKCVNTTRSYDSRIFWESDQKKHQKESVPNQEGEREKIAGADENSREGVHDSHENHHENQLLKVEHYGKHLHGTGYRNS